MDRVGKRAFPALLDEQAALHGDHPFIVHESLDGHVSSLTYADVRELALRYGAALQSAGLEPGARAFVLLRNTADFVPLWFGIMAVGGVFAPGNIYLTAPEIEQLVRLIDPSIIVTETRFLPVLCEAIRTIDKPITLVSVDGVPGTIALPDLVAKAPQLNPVQNQAEDLAQIIFTSGTSSRPKGVMLTHANLIWCGLAGSANTDLSKWDRSFNNKPLFHVNCQETVLSCLMVGATAIIGERYSASRYISQLIRHDATICSLSGMICRTLINQAPHENDRAHRIRFAGYGINISEREMTAFTERFGMRIRNGYGQSEAMVYISLEALGSPSTYPSIGRPAFGREVFIVDERNCILPANQIGEIVVRGDPGRNLMLGYYRDENATSAAFDGGWLHTGDLGSFDATGNLYFQGRLGDMIKRAGENISVQEVEDVLVGHHAVKDAAVIGVQDPVRDQAVKAFVVLQEGCAAGADELREFCSTRLAYFKVPEFFDFLPELPRNASGKVMKRQLEAASGDTSNRGLSS